MYDQFSETEVFVIKKLRILPVFAALLLLIGCAAQGAAEDVVQDEGNANVAAEEPKRALLGIGEFFTIAGMILTALGLFLLLLEAIKE